MLYQYVSVDGKKISFDDLIGFICCQGYDRAINGEMSRCIFWLCLFSISALKAIAECIPLLRHWNVFYGLDPKFEACSHFIFFPYVLNSSNLFLFLLLFFFRKVTRQLDGIMLWVGVEREVGRGFLLEFFNLLVWQECKTGRDWSATVTGVWMEHGEWMEWVNLGERWLPDRVKLLALSDFQIDK